MNKNETLDHMLALTEEVNILTQRLEPHDTGYIHTTISKSIWNQDKRYPNS